MAKTLRKSSPEVPSPRYSNLRRSIGARKRRASVVAQYSIDLNSENTIQDREVDENDQNDALEVLVKKATWQVCCVSPLHGLQCSAVRLKQYALKIRQHLASSLRSSNPVTYSASLTLLPGLKLELQHPDALKIMVWGSEGEGEEEQVRLLYHGVLLTWGTSAHTQDSSTHLPLLLEHGVGRVAVRVRQMLSKLFDCVITHLTFTQSHLVLFSALLGSSPPAEGARLVGFCYSVPHTRTPTSLTVHMELEDIHNFWKQCFGGSEVLVHDTTSSQRLYALFQNHIAEHHGLEVGTLQLERLLHPGLQVQSNGQVRLRTLPASRLALRALCQMATLLHTATPSLATDHT